MRERFRGNQFRTTMVCVDSYENGVLSGRFYNPYQKVGVTFRSLSQFILKMERELDAMNLPQSFTAARSFVSAAGLEDGGTPREEFRPGTLATFAVRVIFRQNTSWQGSVLWMEEKVERTFRSVLELILLMDGALSGAYLEEDPPLLSAEA